MESDMVEREGERKRENEKLREREIWKEIDRGRERETERVIKRKRIYEREGEREIGGTTVFVCLFNFFVCVFLNVRESELMICFFWRTRKVIFSAKSFLCSVRFKFKIEN